MSVPSPSMSSFMSSFTSSPPSPLTGTTGASGTARPRTALTSARLLGLLTLVTATVLLLAACGSGDQVDLGAGGGTADREGDDGDDGEPADGGGAAGGPTRPWIAGQWTLQSATGDGVELTIPAGLTLELSIAGPDQISGDLGCNRFDGTISAPRDDDRDGGSLSLDDLAQTEMACEHLAFETAYAPLLGVVDEWELAPPAGLVLRGEGVELAYSAAAPVAPASLEGTPWRFDTVYSGDGANRAASTPRMDKPPVSAVVEAGRVTLTSEDCGTTVLDVIYEPGTEGSFAPADPAAVAGCADPESNMETVVTGIGAATGYQIFENRLTLIGLPGETVSFVADDG